MGNLTLKSNLQPLRPIHTSGFNSAFHLRRWENVGYHAELNFRDFILKTKTPPPLARLESRHLQLFLSLSNIWSRFIMPRPKTEGRSGLLSCCLSPLLSVPVLRGQMIGHDASVDSLLCLFVKETSWFVEEWKSQPAAITPASESMRRRKTPSFKQAFLSLPVAQSHTLSAIFSPSFSVPSETFAISDEDKFHSLLTLCASAACYRALHPSEPQDDCRTKTTSSSGCNTNMHSSSCSAGSYSHSSAFTESHFPFQPHEEMDSWWEACWTIKNGFKERFN